VLEVKTGCVQIPFWTWVLVATLATHDDVSSPEQCHAVPTRIGAVTVGDFGAIPDGGFEVDFAKIEVARNSPAISVEGRSAFLARIALRLTQVRFWASPLSVRRRRACVATPPMRFLALVLRRSLRSWTTLPVIRAQHGSELEASGLRQETCTWCTVACEAGPASYRPRQRRARFRRGDRPNSSQGETP
jgi:hypothetical protein